MSAQAVATRRTTPPAHHLHRPVVRRLGPHQWAWTCPCGSGIHACTHAVTDHHTAFVAARHHLLSTPGA